MISLNVDHEKADRRELLWRRASLLSIMLGAFIFGAGANPLASIEVPTFWATFVALLASFYGILRGDLAGMTLSALGSVVLGSALVGGMLPNWAFALGVPIAMPGIAYRIYCPV
jgi:hypothetical protein